MELFQHDYGQGSKVVDNTDITTTLLYFSTEELKEFKSLCKKAMRVEFGQDYIAKGNLSDLLLIILRRGYGTEINIEKTNYRSGDEQPYREVLDRNPLHGGDIY